MGKKRANHQNRWVELFKKHGRTMIEIAGLIGVIAALIQLNLQQKQFAYEQSQKPNLVYFYQILPSEIDLKEVDRLSNELEEEFYATLIQEKKQFPTKDYSGLTNDILPLTKYLTSNQFVLHVDIVNNGKSTAAKVRVKLDASYPIHSIDVKSNEPSSVIEGGNGNNSATIQIDRLVVHDFSSINIILQNNTQTSDRIVLFHQLDKDNPLEVQSYNVGGSPFRFEVNKDDTLLQIANQFYLDAALQILPEMIYIPSKQPVIKLFVSSDEGAASNSSLPIPTPTP